MAWQQRYEAQAPAREDVDGMQGPVVVEFGTNWCGYCAGAQPLIEQAFADHDAVRHIKVEDGPGRRLGRTFGVKLWPTLVFMRDGREVSRLVRPTDAEAVRRALSEIAGA